MTLSPPNKKQDTIIGRLVIEQGLATRDEVQDCLAQQADLAKEQNNRSLADLLVENGHLTRRQVERIRPLAEEQGVYQQIPGYQILSKLGSGAMATVYKAKQISLDRIVAVKVLPKRMSSNKDFVERFYREGRAAAKLNHPNIVGADRRRRGQRLSLLRHGIRRRRNRPRPPRKRRTLFAKKKPSTSSPRSPARLAHAHKAGFIHRDVKPKNIMITPDGVAKLTDMGLARETGDLQAAQAEAGKAYGTPYYISPEQIRGELDVDQRADLSPWRHLLSHGHRPRPL